VSETPGTPVCDCYPEGVSPEAYEGPQEWCDVHGQARRVLIQHRDAARALVDKLRAERDQLEQDRDDWFDVARGATAEAAAAELRGAEKARAELADRYVEQLRRQETVHDACEGHALCDLVSELDRAAVVAEP
jgi:hypothetical protein